MNRRNELIERLTRIGRLKSETQKEINKIEAENFVEIAKKNIGKWYSDNYSFYKILKVEEGKVLGLFSRLYDGEITFCEENIHYTDLRDMEPVTELPEKLQNRIDKLQTLLRQ